MSAQSSEIDRVGEDGIFVMFDGDYHLGLGALANSLYRCGFRGVIYAGFRGEIPPWAQSARTNAGGDFEVSEGCVIRFVPVSFKGSLTNYKPVFILSVIAEHKLSLRRLYYFDVDIIVKAPWHFFQDWVTCGIAVCRDMSEPHMAANHPLRKHWRALAERLGFQCRAIEGYFNAGFFGLSCENLHFLENWALLGEHLPPTGGDRTNPFAMSDQDALNTALMVCEAPVSATEASNMDFSAGGYVMSHAISRAKPWRRHYLVDALRGYPPGTAHKLYWNNCESPIDLYSLPRRVTTRMALAIASAIARFYARR